MTFNGQNYTISFSRMYKPAVGPTSVSYCSCIASDLQFMECLAFGIGFSCQKTVADFFLNMRGA